jgi:hypothetical protein
MIEGSESASLTNGIWTQEAQKHYESYGSGSATLLAD